MAQNRIVYGDEDEVEKKKPEVTLPPLDGMHVVPAHEPTFAATPAQSVLPESVTVNTNEMPELRPHRPNASSIPNYGWKLNSATMDAAQDALKSMAEKPYGRKQAFGGKSIQDIIAETAARYGGMENLRSRSYSTSGGTNMSDQSSAPVLGRYLEGLLDRGPTNRLENILLRRYYGNVGQRSRSMTRGEDYARSENLGPSPVPEMLADVLNAQNIAEDIGLSAQGRAVNEIMSGEISKGRNRADIYNQEVASGSGLIGTEMSATASVLGDLGRGGTRAQTPAERFMQSAPEFIMDEKTGLPDPEKINKVREAFGESSATLPQVITGQPSGGATFTRPRGQLPMQTGTNIPQSKIVGKILPPGLSRIARRNNMTYEGATQMDNGQVGYVFTDANGMQIVIPYVE